MTPREYIEISKRNVNLKEFLSPKQIIGSKDFIDTGYEYIAQRVEEEYGDKLDKETMEVITKLQSFLFVFVEHSCNLSMLKEIG